MESSGSQDQFAISSTFLHALAQLQKRPCLTLAGALPADATLARSLGQASLDRARLGVEMPQQLRRIVDAAENGNLQVGMRQEGFDPVLNRVETIANRIVGRAVDVEGPDGPDGLILGVIAAASIHGLAVLLPAYHPPSPERWACAAFASDSFVRYCWEFTWPGVSCEPGEANDCSG